VADEMIYMPAVALYTYGLLQSMKSSSISLQSVLCK